MLRPFLTQPAHSESGAALPTALEQAVLEMIPEKSVNITVGGRAVSGTEQNEEAEIQAAREDIIMARGGPEFESCLPEWAMGEAWGADSTGPTKTLNSLIEVRQTLLVRSSALNS